MGDDVRGPEVAARTVSDCFNLDRTAAFELISGAGR